MTLDEMRQLDAVKTYKELEEAKAEIERLRKANFQLREGAEEQKQRIQRLEELGKELRECASQLGWSSSDDSRWIERAEAAVKAWDKEAKP